MTDDDDMELKVAGERFVSALAAPRPPSSICATS